MLTGAARYKYAGAVQHICAASSNSSTEHTGSVQHSIKELLNTAYNSCSTQLVGAAQHSILELLNTGMLETFNTYACICSLLSCSTHHSVSAQNRLVDLLDTALKSLSTKLARAATTVP